MNSVSTGWLFKSSSCIVVNRECDHHDYVKIWPSIHGYHFREGPTTPHRKTTAFLVRDDWQASIICEKAVDRSYAMKIVDHELRVIATTVHLPDTSFSFDVFKAELDNVENLIHDMIGSNPESWNIWVGGDFNASLGECESDDGAIVGESAFGKRDRRGCYLAEWAHRMGLCALNTMGRLGRDRAMTHYKWGTEYGSQLDYVFVSLSLLHGRSCAQPFWSISTATDHKFVISQFFSTDRLTSSMAIQGKRFS